MLGSATPSMEALYNTETKPDWTLAVMKERPGKALLPAIEIVNMRKALKKQGATQAFSNELKQALIETHKKGGEVRSSFEPARLRIVSHVRGMRLRSRVSALLNLADLS